ncbi:MAG TPA: trypsin-like peptidase domain-containing protein, partial [Planctomycetaceae bacterium]|nr:trypsin-like peptidase domain-containing protein [Planctomycetaceae bacterium]
MRVDVTCPSCFEGFTVKEELVGQRIKCRACGETVRVPDGDEAQRGSRSRGGKRKSHANHNVGLVVGLVAGIGGTAVVAGAVIAVAIMSRSSSPPAPTAPAAVVAAPVVAPPVAPVTTAAPATTATSVAAATPVTTTADVKAADPAVAQLSSKGTSTPDKPEKKEPLDLPELIEAVEPSVVKINMDDGRGTGSGYVVDTNGTVVTNYHVIAGVKSATVKFANGFEAKVLGVRLTIPKKDIAIIKIDAPKEKLHPITLSKTLPKKGISVVAFGAPEGFSFSTTEGIVSAVRSAQELREELGVDYEGTWVQTSTPLSPGMSGGPLVDRAGNLVAMTTLGHRT